MGHKTMDAAVEKLKHGPGEVVSFPEPEMSEEYRIVGMKVNSFGVFRPDSAEAKLKIPAAAIVKAMLDLGNSTNDPFIKRLTDVSITNVQQAVWAAVDALKMAGVDPDLTDPKGR